MISLSKKINQKVNGLIRSFIITGIILLMLGVLIVWTEFMLRLVVGMVVIIMAFAFFAAARKIYSIKKEVEKFLG